MTVSDAGSRAGPLESYLSPGKSREGKKGKGRREEGRRREAGLGLKDLFSWTPCAQVAKWDTESGRGLSSLFLCEA